MLSGVVWYRAMKKWEDVIRERGVTPPPTSNMQMTVAQLIELHNSTTVSADSRAPSPALAHDSFLSDLSF